MNILLINHYAGSTRHGMEYRPFYMAREWIRQGHRVAVVAASVSHLRTVAPAVHASLAEETVEGVPYIWLKTPGYRGNGVRRTLNMFAFVRQLLRHGEGLARRLRPDVVIASSTYPLDNVPARRIARRSGARLVYEVHDLWPLSPIELGGMSPRHPFIRLMQWAEDYACANADRVVSMLPNAASHLEEHGMAPGKFACVPNGIDVAEWQGAGAPMPEEHREALARLRAGGRFLIGYAGGHGVSNALDTLVDAAGRARERAFAFVLVGKGPEKAALQQRAREQGLENVCFLPPVSKAAVPDLLAAMDALYIGWQKRPIYRFGISPNKLMDYMMAGRPVLHAVEAANEPVRESGCGLTIPPEDPEALVRAVDCLMRLGPEEREAMGRQGREYVLARHDYRVLARRFLEALA